MTDIEKKYQQYLSEAIGNVKKAQTQAQVAAVLYSGVDSEDVDSIDTFLYRHYHCRYSKSKSRWVRDADQHHDWNQKLDLNDVKTMVLTGLRALKKSVDIND